MAWVWLGLGFGLDLVWSSLELFVDWVELRRMDWLVWLGRRDSLCGWKGTLVGDDTAGSLPMSGLSRGVSSGAGGGDCLRSSVRLAPLPSAWVALKGLEEARLPELHSDELPEGVVCLRLRD